MSVARFSYKRIIKQSLPVIVAVLFLSVITGSTLESTVNLIVKVHPVLIILIPSFINIAGDLADVFCSRLSTYLYTGQLTTRFQPFRIYIVNLVAVLSVALTGFSFSAFFANLIAGLVFGKFTSWFKLYIVIILAGLSAAFIVTVIGSIILRLVYVKGLDPDSMLAPITTALGDLIGTVLLIFFSKQIL